MYDYKALEALRASGAVSRFHTVRLIAPETVAEHSFNVVNLVLALTDCRASRHLILAALTHDMGEYVVGDIPSPIKRRLPEQVRAEVARAEEEAIESLHPGLADRNILGTLTELESRILAIADVLDGLMKCIEELKMGNATITPIGLRYREYLTQIKLPTYWPNVSPIVDQCITMFNEVMYEY